MNKEPRLRFTDEERSDPALEKPIRKAEKAAARADKAQANIPKKKVRQTAVSYTHLFCAEGLTGTRRTQNQAVRVFQQLSIHHDEVVGQGVDAIVCLLYTSPQV